MLTHQTEHVLYIEGVADDQEPVIWIQVKDPKIIKKINRGFERWYRPATEEEENERKDKSYEPTDQGSKNSNKTAATPRRQTRSQSLAALYQQNWGSIYQAKKSEDEKSDQDKDEEEPKTKDEEETDNPEKDQPDDEQKDKPADEEAAKGREEDEEPEEKLESTPQTSPEKKTKTLSERRDKRKKVDPAGETVRETKKKKKTH